jgi:hypothetical protein
MTIPFSLSWLMPVVFNLVKVIWLFASMSQKVKTLEAEIASLKRDNSLLNSQLNALSITLARVGEKVIRSLHEDVARADGLLKNGISSA